MVKRPHWVRSLPLVEIYFSFRKSIFPLKYMAWNPPSLHLREHPELGVMRPSILSSQRTCWGLQPRKGLRPRPVADSSVTTVVTSCSLLRAARVSVGPAVSLEADDGFLCFVSLCDWATLGEPHRICLLRSFPGCGPREEGLPQGRLREVRMLDKHFKIGCQHRI